MGRATLGGAAEPKLGDHMLMARLGTGNKNM